MQTKLTSAENHTFSNQDFSSQEWRGLTFTDCVFEKCDFTETSFEQAAFWGCTFKGCNLSVVDLKDCRIENVLFDESKLSGLNFARCDTSLLFSINATKSLLNYCDFSELAMKGSLFKECQIYRCRFNGTNLEKANFSGSDLKGTTFAQCFLKEANFKGAKDYLINPCENNVAKAVFSFPACVGLIQALDVKIEDL